MTPLLIALTDRNQRVPINSSAIGKTSSDVAQVRQIDPSMKSATDVGAHLQDKNLPLGIDRIALSFPIVEIREDSQDLWEDSMRGRGRRLYGKTTIPIGQGSAFFKVNGSQAGYRAYLEFNPSTILHGKNTTELATLPELEEILNDLLSEIDYLVHYAVPLEDFRLSRLDITAQIPHVADVQGILVKASKSPYRLGLATELRQTKRSIQSLACRTKSTGGYLMYDKARKAKVGSGLLRCEATARRRLLGQICPTYGVLDVNRCRDIFNHFYGVVSTDLREMPTTDFGPMLTSKRDTWTLIEILGISALNGLGHYPEISHYRIANRYRPFYSRFPYLSVHGLPPGLTR